MPEDPTVPPEEGRETSDPGGDDGQVAGPSPATWAGRAGAEEATAGDQAVAKPEPEDGADAGSTAERVAAGETVEADTLSLADREAAEEAALQGLKARAARQQAQRETGAWTAGPPAQAEPATPADEPATPGGEPATPAPQASPEPGVVGPAPPTSGEGVNAPRPRALWARFLAASLLIVVSTATATAVSLMLVLTDLAEGIGGIPEVEQELTPVGGGDPQTILLLGSDERIGAEGDENGARSDTAILLRVDPHDDAIRLLSIPRDLRVNIPGVGVDKFNAAYQEGGPRLALRVVKQLTGLEVNHVVNIDFTGFAETVNAIDCVFIDADRHYYIPPETGIAEIDVEAGYQRLCGLKALQYVRFRHDDNDLVRAARQQDFLREARQKIPASKMLSNHEEFIDIFKQYTTSSESLANWTQLLELVKTFLGARGAPVTELHFPAQLRGPRSPYVTARERAIRQTVNRFLGEGSSPGSGPSERGGGDGGGQSRQGGGGQGGGGSRGQQAPPMVDSGATAEYARMVSEQTSRTGRRQFVDFPVEYPGQVPARTTFGSIDDSRAFDIDSPGRPHQGYKLVFGVPHEAGFAEYWGVSGTNWPDPPILENPSEVREIAGQQRMLFYDGDRLRLVGWKQGRRTYWVQNTLLQSLSEAEMLAIVRSMRQLGG